ncbi:MAG: hypothetical protein QX189_09145 [Methylococcales bacterium]
MILSIQVGGNDTFLSRGFYGAGNYNGGADTDMLDFSQSDAYTDGRRANEGTGVKVDLLAGKASTYYLRASNVTWTDANGQIALTGIENVLGTTQSDLITGDATANVLDGGASDVYNRGVIDTLNGEAGNDTFLSRGFFGAGIYTGGADTDLLDFSQSDAYTDGRRANEGAGVKVDLLAGTASTYYLRASNVTWTDANGQITLATIENVRGTNQADSLSGDASINVLEGGNGADILVGWFRAR